MLYGVVWLITAPLRLLPNASLSPSISEAIISANSYLSAINFVFPLSTFLIIFGIILSIETFIIIWKIVNWLIKKIPTIS